VEGAGAVDPPIAAMTAAAEPAPAEPDAEDQAARQPRTGT